MRGVSDCAASAYERRMVTAAARPHGFWIGKDRELVRRWPIGPALLEALGDINRDVQEALADERTRLSEHGYSEDLPLPALWWVPAPAAETEAAEQLLSGGPRHRLGRTSLYASTRCVRFEDCSSSSSAPGRE
jgi:hypothetical protein